MSSCRRSLSRSSRPSPDPSQRFSIGGEGSVTPRPPRTAPSKPAQAGSLRGQLESALALAHYARTGIGLAGGNDERRSHVETGCGDRRHRPLQGQGEERHRPRRRLRARLRDEGRQDRPAREHGRRPGELGERLELNKRTGKGPAYLAAEPPPLLRPNARTRPSRGVASLLASGTRPWVPMRFTPPP